MENRGLTLFFIFQLFFLHVSAEMLTIHAGSWKICFDQTEKTFDFFWSDRQILSDVFAAAKYKKKGSEKVFQVKSSAYSAVEISQEPVSDNFGEGTKYLFTFTSEGLPILTQSIYTYDSLPYFLLEMSLSDSTGLSTNYMAPLVSETGGTFLSQNADNRMLRIPYDNDAWVRYECNTLTQTMTSFEATAVYDGRSRNGLVLGFVDHDHWKDGLKLSASDHVRLDSLRCYSGITDVLTRDSQNGASLRAHGYISGTVVKSSRMFIGFFDDWREGLECFGKANVRVVPQRKWKGGTPFGWNSWGVMAEDVTYNGVKSVSDFYKDQLYNQGFVNDSVVWISLDAYARDNISEFLLKRLIADCQQKGQKVGAYWTPFAEWTGNGDGYLPGSTYKNSDCYLRAGGVPMKLDNGWCLDPTHPGVRAHIAYQLAYYKKLGFKYIKLDFITNAALEADSYNDPAVTTGTQAYNTGMRYLADQAGDEMFLCLGICPVFPYQYGNSRRISCDAWSDINSTQYVMNSLSFGWWLNQFYEYNDPDHLVMVKSGVETYGVNRARITSGAITGLFIFADNFSLDGPAVGFPEKSRERALALMTNKDIQDIARMGRSFMPVEGSRAVYDGAENLFMHHTEDYLYVACINYGMRTIYDTIPLQRLNILASEVDSIKELWTGAACPLSDRGLYYQVPASDARVYRIRKKQDPVLSEVIQVKENPVFSIHPLNSREFEVTSSLPVKEISVFNVLGQRIRTQKTNGNQRQVLMMESGLKGIYLFCIRLEDGRLLARKINVNT